MSSPDLLLLSYLVEPVLTSKLSIPKTTTLPPAPGGAECFRPKQSEGRVFQGSRVCVFCGKRLCPTQLRIESSPAELKWGPPTHQILDRVAWAQLFLSAAPGSILRPRAPRKPWQLYLTGTHTKHSAPQLPGLYLEVSLVHTGFPRLVPVISVHLLTRTHTIAPAVSASTLGASSLVP